ncbi:dTDP-glucose 4,6-dehydratase [Paramagnetospirillum marisnigri]|uniref:dTDP-glucose 4,6-dehydratase n=1 Tax=Paramagnetospirillum marisnigri TaxID=1285242 RepID=A0A178MWC1_9PROT|nr:dTDP-glucose 4,6-dehydratase [Paramagnetospirillum marisnigri]OAN54654.1 dTDP-glucose 4,6-dehydratase [Paramagnetospirillum marisnigri]
MRALVTGGAGFIGSTLVRQLMAETDGTVLTVDKLTYAGRLENLDGVLDDPRHAFAKEDIADRAAMTRLFSEFKPDMVFHLAAESHVDRSIDSAGEFITTNIVGTFVLLECALAHYRGLEGTAKERFRFVHVSTDEVYGSLEPGDMFRETSPYQPNSPYAASKASADLLVRAWVKTHGLPCVITNCSNNYGPRQYPEKLIPLTILNMAEGKPIPIYGDGGQIRDWLHVEDHARALRLIGEKGRVGETYCIGGEAESTNMDLVLTLCAAFDELKPNVAWAPHKSLITHVKDRPGHDRRYATDITKLKTELGWAPRWTLKDGLAATIRWYLDNTAWREAIDAEARARRGTG